jgi:septal ring factor EnvC (AmiA/AmiB activator)
MSDNLEKFISGNRKEFDDKIPSKQSWDNIEAALTGKKKKKTLFRPTIKWSIAAAAMLVAGIYFYIKSDKKASDSNGIVKTEMNEVPDAPKVNEFAKMIVLKQEELKQLAKEQPVLYNKFTKDIIQLDSSYNALKNQLSITPNKEMLVEAMIQNLQLQLSVLNQQLNIIKQIKQSKEYSHEKSYPAT